MITTYSDFRRKLKTYLDELPSTVSQYNAICELRRKNSAKTENKRPPQFIIETAFFILMDGTLPSKLETLAQEPCIFPQFLFNTK